jgi:hypothetical protein
MASLQQRFDAKMEKLEFDSKLVSIGEHWDEHDDVIPKDAELSDDEDEIEVDVIVEPDEECDDEVKPKKTVKSLRRQRPDLDGMTHEVEGNEFLRSLEYKTTHKLKLYISNLKDWILTSNRLNQSDIEQYKMVKTSLDGRGVDGFPSTRKLFGMWKERHTDQKVKEYDGLPVFCYSFNAYEMQEIHERKRDGFKKYLHGVAIRIQAQKNRKDKHETVKKEDPFDNLGDDDCMWVSFYPEMIQYVAQDLGRELRADEKAVIEETLVALSSHLSSDGKYWIEMIADDREVVPQRQVTNILRKYYCDVVKQFGKSNFSTLLGQIPDDKNSLPLRQALVNLYASEVQKSLTMTFSSVLRQMFELDGSVRRKNCLAQTLAGVAHLTRLLEVLQSDYVFDNLNYENLAEFENTLTISFGTTFWRNCLCKLMKFPMPRVRSFQRSSKSHFTQNGLAGPTLGSMCGGVQAYQDEVSKIYSQKTSLLEMQSQHRDMIPKLGVITIGGSAVPPAYKSEQSQKGGGHKKIECQGCGRRIELHGCLLNAHNCTPSKEWKITKAQRALAKQRESERKRSFKNKGSKNRKSSDEMPMWQRRHFQGYRCLTGKMDECQCGSPAHWKYFGKACQDNAVANKIVIEDASKGGYLPASVVAEPGMVEWLTSGKDEVRLRKCPDKQARYQFFKAYVEDLSVVDDEDEDVTEERYRPVVIAVFKINGVEGFELMMDSEDYKSEAHRWKKGDLQLVFNPNADVRDVLPGMEYDLKALFTKNRIDPSFKDGTHLINWLFQSYSGWQYHQKQLSKSNTDVEVADVKAKEASKPKQIVKPKQTIKSSKGQKPKQ